MSAGHQPRILLIDDNQQNRYVLSRILQRANLTVEQFATGYAGLEAVQRGPDLVILDVKLPDVSGYEVCRKIKSNQITAAIPVLQISAAFTSNENKVQALEGGADGYLTHPIEPAVLLATVRSLLRLKQAETSSRLLAEEWQCTFNALAESVVLLDLENKIVRSNLAFEELYLAAGCHGEIVGQDAVPVFKKVLGRKGFLNHGHPARYSGEAQHGARWFRITVDSVEREAERVGSVVVLADITERKLAERSLQNAEKLAATGRLAQTIAHEINNPLEALTNLIYLAQYSATEPPVKEFLHHASTELERVARITKQILSFHRDTKEPVAVDPNELVENVVSLYRPQIAANNMRVEWTRRELPPVAGFPGELRQVIANVLANAVDASPAGATITLRTRRASTGSQEGVVFTIHDCGPGIPRE
ncbi:MAG TPA: response regulator, partial [Candidatus Limnocylindrales bacterium]|nr:response regulator [Candidatus Limnocylindrales bacterium]